MRWGGSLLTSDPCAPSGRGLPRFHLLDLGLRTFKENLSVLRRLSRRVHTQNAALQAPRSLRGPPRICAPRAELEDPEASARPRVRPLQQLGSHSCPLPCPGALAHPTAPHTAPHSGEAPDFGRAPSSRGRPRVFRFSVSAALGRPRCSASDEPARGPCPGGDLWRGGQRPGDRVLGAPALAGAVPRSHLVSRGTGCPRACDRHVAKSLGFCPSGQRERDLEAVWALAGSAGASGRLAVRAGDVAGPPHPVGWPLPRFSPRPADCGAFSSLAGASRGLPL